MFAYSQGILINSKYILMVHNYRRRNIIHENQGVFWDRVGFYIKHIGIDNKTLDETFKGLSIRISNAFHGKENT